MAKLKNLFTRLKKVPKTRYVAILAIVIFAVAIAIPTLSRYKNRINIESLLSAENTWDGTVATSYRNGTGTQNDPYIISNAKELAYFAKMLETTNYENTYFELSNDIIINNGSFDYSKEKGITYKLDTTTFYIKDYTTDIYNDVNKDREKVTSINKFNTLDNFKGNFNGNYYSIYGLYITSNTKTELALFDNLKGKVENLYLENTMIYGGSTTASLATTAANATIKNIFVNGNVVGTTDKKIEVEVTKLEDLVFTKDENKLSETIFLPTIDITEPISVKLTGIYEASVENQEITLYNQKFSPGEFAIDLSTESLDNIELVIDDNIESEITLKELSYEISYQEDTYATSAGVIAKTTSTSLENIINKSSVYSTNEAAGLICTMTNTDLNKSYNTGNITAENISSGIVGTIENSLSETIISKVYNSGKLSAITTNSFINKISNNESVLIENTFNTQEAYYGINMIENTEVTINNVVDVNTIDVSVGETTGTITTDVDEFETNILEDSNYIKETLQYNEYLDSKDLEENAENAWIYEDGYLPILYFDDLNNPLATLYVGTYSWNDLGYDLRSIYIKNQVAFRIASNDELNQYKEAYYYIHKNEQSLATRQDIENITDWTLYEDIYKITEEGYYTIYIKVIDKNDNITYINSERLVVDLKAPEVTLTMNDHTWTELTETTKNINILENTTLKVNATGGYADVKSVKYYISNQELKENELLSIEDTNWLEYNDQIELNECGNYIVYIKVTDAADRIKYINSDTIIFGGYKEELFVGRNTKVDSNEVNITSKSSVTYNFSYEEERVYQSGDKNSLVTNTLLPVNTVMTLINNSTNEVYKYKITSTEDIYGYEESCKTSDCNKKATYPLKNFIKLGQTDTAKVFDEESYINQKKKDLTIIIDFSKAEISNDLTLQAYLELTNSSDVAVVSTLKDSIKKINIYKDKTASVILNKLNEVETINYNSDSETEINFETYLLNQTIDNIQVYDTTTENKKIGLAIKLVDSDGNIVDKRYLKNIQFKIGEKYYSPDNDGIVRINLSSTIEKTTNSLTVITYLSNTGLDIGDYNFVLTPFIADDGIYTSNLNETSISIPVSVTDKYETNYGFNASITMLDENNEEIEFNSIIQKTTEKDEEVKEIPTTTLNINIFDNITLKDKIVKVSLYKKSSLSAIDQSYEIVDLQDYVNTTLTLDEENLYLISDGNVTLEMNNASFENNGYELRFELFDGIRKITTIKKKFIVK